MKIPKPRLRQVFEHSTHFKVAKPGGAMITIPKKALSPTMLGKLRRYAQGGEVQGYADGVEVPEPAEAAAIADVAAGNAAASQPVPASAPVEEVAPQTLPNVIPAPAEKRRVVRADEATGKQLTAEQFAAQDRARMAAQQAPAPVVVNVNTAPAPQPAAAPAPTPARAEEKPAEKPTEPAKKEAAPALAPAPVAAPAPAPKVSRPVPIEEVRLPAAPVDVTRVPPVTIPSQEFVGPVTPYTFAPSREAMGPPELMGPPEPVGVTAPVTPVAAPVVPPAAAPTVTPVAPAGTLPVSPTMAPVLPPPDLKRVTVQEVRDYKAKNPTATFQQAASTLTGGLTFSPLELTQIANIAAQTPEKVRDDAVADLINAKVDEAHAVYDQAVLEAQQAETRYERGLASAAQTQANIEALKQHGEAVRKEAEENDDIKSFWGNQGFWRSVLGIASLAVSGYAAGYAGIENFAYKAFENAVAKDVEEQKRKRSMRWKQYETILGNTEDAEQLYKADLKEVTAAELERLVKYGAVKQVGPQYNAIIAKLRLDAARERELLGLKEQRVEAETIRAEAAKTAAARPRAAGRVSSGAAEAALDYRKKKDEEAATILVDGITNLRLPSAEGRSKISSELAGRSTGVREADKLVDLFQRAGIEGIADLTGPQRGEAIAALSYLIETFPKSFGFQRAISVNAAQQLKKGLQDPTSFKSMALQAFGGGRDIVTPIKVLRNNIADARRDYVASLPAATDVAKAREDVKRVMSAIDQADRTALEEYRRTQSTERRGVGPSTTPVIATGVAPSVVAPGGSFTITETKSGKSRQTTDASIAAKFRGQSGFTVVP